MKLFAKMKAPDFEMQDIYGNPVRLSDYKGKKVVLGFYRNVNCPFCNMRVHQLMKMKDSLSEQNTEMIFFFESSAKVILRSSFHQGISPIPLIADPEKKIYAEWGVERSKIKMFKTMLSAANREALKAGMQLDLPKEKDVDASQDLIPADFLIDEDQIIQKAHYGNHLNDHIDLMEIRSFSRSREPIAIF